MILHYPLKHWSLDYVSLISRPVRMFWFPFSCVLHIDEYCLFPCSTFISDNAAWSVFERTYFLTVAFCDGHETYDIWYKNNLYTVILAFTFTSKAWISWELSRSDVHDPQIGGTSILGVDTRLVNVLPAKFKWMCVFFVWFTIIHDNNNDNDE